jgi:hypothetical protein
VEFEVAYPLRNGTSQSFPRIGKVADLFFQGWEGFGAWFSKPWKNAALIFMSWVLSSRALDPSEFEGDS